MCEQISKNIPIIFGIICAICILILLIGCIICNINNVEIGDWAFYVFMCGLGSGIIALLNLT